MNYGDFPLDETIHVFFTTRAFATGIPGTLSAATVAIYEDITATPIQTSVGVTETLNSIAGLNAVPIVATSGNGYEVGKNYHVVIEAGEVDSVSVVGEVVAYFSIGRSAAAVDLAQSTDGLGAIKTDTAAVKVVTDKFAFTVANQVDANTLQIEGADATDAINAACDASIVTYGLDHLVFASVADEVVDDSIIAKLTDSGATADWSDYVHTTDSLRAIRDHATTIKDETVLILADTDDIGVAGAGLTDLGGMSTGMKGEVNAEVDGALDTSIAELSQGAPTATPTVRTALMLLYMALRNKTSVQTSGTDALEINNDAGTIIAKKLITDDGSDYVEAEMTSGA